MTNIKLKDLSIRDRTRVRIAAFISRLISPIDRAVHDTVLNAVLNHVTAHDIQEPCKMTYKHITISLGEKTEESS